MSKKRILTLLLLALSLPALAVFKEEDLTSTLSLLLSELKQEYEALTARDNQGQARIAKQHQDLVELVEESNELSLMLYSQSQDNTFDLTYALDQITRQYEEFDRDRKPYDRIIGRMQVELERYSRLSQTLRNIPPVRRDPSTIPQAVTVMDSINVSIDTLVAMPSFAVKEGFELDSVGIVRRDSCLILAEAMVDHYIQLISKIEKDSQYYSETDLVLKEAYDYAQNRFKELQRQMFLEGEKDYFQILKDGRYLRKAKKDILARYLYSGLDDDEMELTSWKGPIVWVFAFLMLFLLGLAILLGSLIVRLTMRWVPYFRTPYFKEHRGLIISLVGVVVFTITSILLSLPEKESEDVLLINLAFRMMAEYAALLGAILLSILIRMENRTQTRAAVLAYLPTLSMAFLVIFLRIIFVPNSVLYIAFPPLVAVFTLWQLVMNFVKMKSLPKSDITMLWVSCAVMAASTVLSFIGLVMMALLVQVWWFFQLMFMQILTAFSILQHRYYKKHQSQHQLNYRKKHPYLPLSSAKGAFIEVTWLHDMLEMLLLPLMSIWSFPFAMVLSCKVFKISGVAKDLFFQPFLHVEGVVHLSLFKFLLVLSLFFLFRYLVYAIKAFYKVWRSRSCIRKLDKPELFKETDINFNLANNIITLVGWGIYVITSFVLLKIPTSALTIITTGLATGIGFALKDVLNNFFYGVQLMGGRVRVGDTIECDGIRGQVESLSYQSTQVASEDGSIIAFTNTALFNKNFKNLTRNHQYEMINFTVGVKYGTDVERARQIIREALDPLLVKDKYGRDLVDMKKGIAIRLRNFGDSAIDIQVLLFAAVEVHYSFAAAAKEAIYNAFNQNGIEIPFPQQDVYIKEAPAK